MVVVVVVVVVEVVVVAVGKRRISHSVNNPELHFHPGKHS